MHMFYLVQFDTTVTLTQQVDPFYSVSAAHEVEENVRDEIRKSHPEVAEVFIHIGNNFILFNPCTVSGKLHRFIGITVLLQPFFWE